MTTANKAAKVVSEGGRFFLEADGLRQELPAGALTDTAVLQELSSSGQDVELVYATPKPWVVAINPKLPKFPRILCYVPPAPWIFERSSLVSNPEMRKNLAAKLRDAGVLTQQLHDQVAK